MNDWLESNKLVHTVIIFPSQVCYAATLFCDSAILCVLCVCHATLWGCAKMNFELYCSWSVCVAATPHFRNQQSCYEPMYIATRRHIINVKNFVGTCLNHCIQELAMYGVKHV